VLRDHGGWAGVLARSKANAARALAAEKTRQANQEVKAAEIRRVTMRAFREGLEFIHSKRATHPSLRLLEDRSAEGQAADKEELSLELDLAIVSNTFATAAAVLHAHGRSINLSACL
jgi:hypothetical protein